VAPPLKQPPHRWDFAQTHNLILPDEYDRINLDLAPFWALPRHEVRERMRLVEEMNETFTLVVRKGEVDIEVGTGGKGGHRGEGRRRADGCVVERGCGGRSRIRAGWIGKGRIQELWMLLR
jgi:hypothetical protein